MLFIAPIPGKKKSELAYSSVIKEEEEDKDIPNLQIPEKNGASLNNTLQMRFHNIVKRPKKSGSKVRLP